MQAYAQTSSTMTSNQAFEATFGENPFSRVVNASVSNLPLASASAHGSLTTQFVPGPGGFSEFSATTNGNFTASVVNFGTDFVTAITFSEVDITFHLDSAESYELTGTASVNSSIGLSQVSPDNGPIFDAPSGNFASFGTLAPGDYALHAGNYIESQLGFVSGGKFDLDLKLAAVPEPSALVMVAFGGLSLVVAVHRRLSKLRT